MAKDVDLSSNEWTDIVFEGKNKEFGAYELRRDSAHRHTRAVVIVIVALALIVGYLVLSINGVFDTPEETADAQLVKETVDTGEAEEEEEEEEEQIEAPLDEPEPEPEDVQEEEEVAATQQLTELAIKDEVEKEKEVKDMDEVLKDDRAIGNVNQEGVADLNKEAIRKEVVEEKPKEEPKVVKEEGPVSMAMVEQKPSFPGGDKAMYEWLNKNINYPPAAAEDGASGKVTVQFVVEKDGSISHVTIARGKHPALDEEAKRVVKKMPKWTPGRNNGQPVRVTYLLPISFQLQ